MLSNGVCCDDANCTTDCNSQLWLCIRTAGTSRNNSDCPTGRKSLGIIGGDNVTFTDAVGDEENPLVLQVNILPAVRFFVYHHLHALVALILTWHSSHPVYFTEWIPTVHIVFGPSLYHWLVPD